MSGNLVCYVPPSAAGNPGLYEVGLDGSRRLVTSAAGIPMAVLTM